MAGNRINVTKTYMPDLGEYQGYLEQLWESGWITNQGPLVQQLEQKLKEYLGVKHIFPLSNGTIAIQAAIRALGIQGEIITTPFSYVATVNSILWEHCAPRFADIKADDFCIDPESIAKIVGPSTKAIMPVPVYGLPCDYEAIDAIAKECGLKVIYDAAHAFACKLNGNSLFNFGDVATVSFHATKVFHTIEGGAVITNDDELARQMTLMMTFGHREDDYYTLGINGKMNEFQAAMGLCMLHKMPELIEKRKEICQAYDTHLDGLPISRPQAQFGELEYNYAYYPVLFESEDILIQVMQSLKVENIHPRRYFYPSLNKLPFLKDIEACPVSEAIANRVMCLPLFPQLGLDEVQRISGIVKTTLTA